MHRKYGKGGGKSKAAGAYSKNSSGSNLAGHGGQRSAFGKASVKGKTP